MQSKISFLKKYDTYTYVYLPPASKFRRTKVKFVFEVSCVSAIFENQQILRQKMKDSK